jgi:hypothetical protein
MAVRRIQIRWSIFNFRGIVVVTTIVALAVLTYDAIMWAQNISGSSDLKRFFVIGNNHDGLHPAQS